jgi:hypothetical protein
MWGVVQSSEALWRELELDGSLNEQLAIAMQCNANDWKRTIFVSSTF